MARSFFWGFDLKTKGCIGIVSPGAVFGVWSGILPPGRLRLYGTCWIVSFSKSTRSSTVMIPSFPNYTTVLSGIPICAAFWKKAVVWEFVKNFNYLYSFSYLVVGSASYYSLLYLVFGGLGLNILFHILWYQYPCSRGVGSFLLLCRCLRV